MQKKKSINYWKNKILSLLRIKYPIQYRTNASQIIVVLFCSYKQLYQVEDNLSVACPKQEKVSQEIILHPRLWKFSIYISFSFLNVSIVLKFFSFFHSYDLPLIPKIIDSFNCRHILRKVSVNSVACGLLLYIYTYNIYIHIYSLHKGQPAMLKQPHYATWYTVIRRGGPKQLTQSKSGALAFQNWR